MGRDVVWAKLAAFLRHLLPPDPDVEAADARIVELENEVEVLRTARDRYTGLYGSMCDRASRAEAELLALQREPPVVDGCSKIRLRSYEEAVAFAEKLWGDRGDDTEPYECRTCPRQPLDLRNFWHLRNKNKVLRGERGRIERGKREWEQRRREPSLTHRMQIPPFDA